MRITFILMSFISISIFSCKKYGFNAKDGFEDYIDTLPHANDTSLNAPDYSFIAQATIFPGLVGASEKRIDTSISINMLFNQVTTTQLKIQSVPRVLNNIGLYAAPGEPIKVIVPTGVYNLVAQIGPWTDNLSAKANPRRYPNISASFQLQPGVNYIRNPFGGCIFISPSISQNNTVTVNVSGAVKAPDFFIDRTNSDEWVKTMNSTTVPFFILRGRYSAFVLPTDLYKANPFSNPQELISYWDKIMQNSYFKYTGLSTDPANSLDQAPLLPVFYVFDADISTGYWHSGFPIMVTSDVNTFNIVTNLNRIKTKGAWEAMHENGHNYQMTNMLDVSGVTTEVSCNLYSIFYAHESNISYKTILDGKDSVAVAFAYLSSTTDTTITMLKQSNPKLVMYAQLFNKMPNGWGFWPYLYQQARRQTRSFISDIEKWSFLYTTACAYFNVDMAPFFNMWKIPINTSAKIQMSAIYPSLNQDIWNYNPVTDAGGTLKVVESNTTWKVLNYDSQETTSEKGYATNTIDGNTATYWSAKYSGTPAIYPHYISYDLGKAQLLSGLYFYQKIGDPQFITGRISTMNIYTSTNGVSWTSFMTGVSLDNISTKQVVPFNKMTSIRYLKVEFTAPYVSLTPFASMAEIGAY